MIGYEIEGSGTVWSALSDRGEAMDLVAAHVDEMIDPDGDLSKLAAEMVEAFIAADCGTCGTGQSSNACACASARYPLPLRERVAEHRRCEAG